MSDGNYGSTTIGLMMDDVVKPGEKRSEVVERIFNMEAQYIEAKFKELGFEAE